MTTATDRDNNFDFIRLLAATLVWYWHCYALKNLPDPLRPWITFESPGKMGVSIFFIISGYFIAASYDHHRGLLAFIRNRGLRIFPALIVVVFLCALLLGPLLSTREVHSYFRDPSTWHYLTTAQAYRVQYNLPGLFDGNPVSAVNGSLWTLPIECKCYAAIALLGVLGILQPRLVLFAVLALYFLRVWGIVVLPIYFSDIEMMLPLCGLFAGGALMYVARDRLPLKLPFFIVCALLLALSTRLQPLEGQMLFDASLTYGIIYLGFARLRVLPQMGRFGDFSYGMYLYAYPVQQTLIHCYPHMRFHFFMAASFTLSLFCAFLSWHWVEKPALSLKA